MSKQKAVPLLEIKVSLAVGPICLSQTCKFSSTLTQLQPEGESCGGSLGKVSIVSYCFWQENIEVCEDVKMPQESSACIGAWTAVCLQWVVQSPSWLGMSHRWRVSGRQSPRSCLSVCLEGWGCGLTPPLSSPGPSSRTPTLPHSVL